MLVLCREDETPAAWQLADSLYWQAFRKATAPLQHAHDHEKLISKIADLYAAIPHRDAAPAAATLDSVHCIALTHACICMLAASLACPEKRQPFMAGLSGHHAQEATAALQAIFRASRHHEHLLLTCVSKAAPNNPHVLVEVLQAPIAAVLGNWVKSWEKAFR